MLNPNSLLIGNLLDRWNAGEREALNSLVPVIYRELHRLAHYYLQGERSGHTLQTTALVHEAYLRLARDEPGRAQNREHLVAIAARLMRQVLVDYARGRGAGKRGGNRTIQIHQELEVPQKKGTDVVALDDALIRLAKIDPEQSLIVELRYFGGLTLEEIAAVLNISVATAKREWTMAKAWLFRELRKDENGKRTALGKD